MTPIGERRPRPTGFEREVVNIHPGEYFATSEDAIISTLLGSCVAVGLFDEEAGAGGLNHFMLARDDGSGGLVGRARAKYGRYAMELLIEDLIRLGARKGSIKAKVFGGGSVLDAGCSSCEKVSEGNIDFAFKYLANEGIPVVASDVGGNEPRKIFFFARTGKVLLQRISKTSDTTPRQLRQGA